MLEGEQQHGVRIDRLLHQCCRRGARAPGEASFEDMEAPPMLLGDTSVARLAVIGPVYLSIQPSNSQVVTVQDPGL